MGDFDPVEFEAYADTVIQYTFEGWKELLRIWNAFEKEQKVAVPRVIEKITITLKPLVQRRSPYLYGILRGAHIATTEGRGHDATGVIGIHPATTHPVLGGRPATYGLRIHNEEGRPWFEQTVEADAERVVMKYGASLGEMYTNVAKARYIGPKALWRKWW